MVVRCPRAWLQEDRTTRARGTGRVPNTTKRQDRRPRLLAIRDRFSTTKAIANQWFVEQGRVIGIRSVYTRIRSFGLFSYWPHWSAWITLEYFEQSEINLYPWPRSSSHLSTIEHLWDIIGRRLRSLQPSPLNVDPL
ncbi:hypothetical protein ABEB36_010855 [Hypothenemus hampei]|uniref:Transposase n=1 Tax=Hypothenemus hampei TaxID=57062 RepID=A0ABD1ED95_HYPHA